MNKSISNQSLFEQIRKVNQYDAEYWSARELMEILEYVKWSNFKNAISKAMEACNNSGQVYSDHFADTSKMVDIGSNAKREVDDYQLSRYACYLVIQNADPEKEMVALGQTYFAVQTNKQELFQQASEDDKRLMLKQELEKHNTHLANSAQNTTMESIMDFGVFQNHCYKGILDHMDSTELASILFQATQTEEKFRQENIQGKIKTNLRHIKVGPEVKQTIEELPTPENMKIVERKTKKLPPNLND